MDQAWNMIIKHIRVIRKVANDWKVLEPDDLVQECIINAYKKFKYFNEKKGSFSTWVTMIARQTCTDQYRFWNYKTRKPEDPILDIDDYDPLCPNIESVDESLELIDNLFKDVHIRPSEEPMMTLLKKHGRIVARDKREQNLWARIKNRVREQKKFEEFLGYII